MIENYVIKLIDNLPDNIKNCKEPKHIDLVLDGGVFNGSYLIGALYFLKEMERRNYIKIDRVSGCSIGSFVAFLYFIDKLDTMYDLYEIVNKDFRQSYKLKIIKEIKTYIEKDIPDNICEKVNDRLFISYNNIKKGKKTIKSSYKNVDEIINSIIKSCFVPFLIDGDILYENKYVDGINPYFFEKERNKKILHLDLLGYDKINNLLNVKNEKTNFHRVLSGLLDIHCFFIKETSTSMCSYVNDWNVSNRLFFYFKQSIELVCIYLIYILLFVKEKLPDEFRETITYKIVSKISYEIFVILLEKYCL